MYIMSGAYVNIHACLIKDLFSANSHLIQSRLKIDITSIIAYTGYTPWWERATVAQSL